MNQNTKIKVAVVGASGYSGEELLRLLQVHPRIKLACVTSRQYAGQPVSKIFPRFVGQSLGTFSAPKIDAITRVAEVAFLALPHGVASVFAGPLLKKGMKVIDLSADFRTHKPQVYQTFYGHRHQVPQLLKEAVYGLPERYREQIKKARFVAAPGCYPTSVILAAAPALAKGLINLQSIVATSLSGVSGAGRKTELEYLFVECNESARAYGVPVHRHLGEMEQELTAIAGKEIRISFTPHLIPLNRGIFTTLYAKVLKPIRQDIITRLYRDFYAQEPFVRFLEDRLPDTKNVELTNYCDIAVRVDKHTGRLIVLVALDNLTKGAAGQAIQCLNLMCGFDETTGLK